MTDYVLVQANDCGMRPLGEGSPDELKRLVSLKHPWEETETGWWAWQSRRFMVGYHIWPNEEWDAWLLEHPMVFVEPYVISR